jgi:hypothetical protein
MKFRMAMLTVLLAAAGCRSPVANNLPPAEQLMHPGPGVDGPGPGVMMLGPPAPGMAASLSSQVAFIGPEGMQVSWDVSAPGMFDSDPLICPGRYNFPQGALYRLRLSNVPGRSGVELFPSLEVAPSMPRTDAYLAHNAIPVQFNEEDFDQVLSGNFVTKVIYLPDSEFQELAVAGVETLVSTRLDPGVDPITEADRRGSIMAIVRIGDKDLQIPEPEMVGDVTAAGYCAPGDVPPPFVAGVTSPQYGMTTSGTPIGLPGPPHIPLGVPAGLQRHTIANHTHYHLPRPTRAIHMHVRQTPGYSYPRPANRVIVRERTSAPPAHFSAPLGSGRVRSH